MNISIFYKYNAYAVAFLVCAVCKQHVLYSLNEKTSFVKIQLVNKKVPQRSLESWERWGIALGGQKDETEGRM